MNNNNKKANSYWILWGAGGIGGCLGITNEIIKKKKKTERLIHTNNRYLV